MSLTFTLSGTPLTGIPVPGLPGSGMPWQLKEAADKGSSDTGTFHLDDEAAAYDLPPWGPLRVTESAASPTMLAAGYLTNRSVARGKVALQAGTERQWDPTVIDLNVLLSDRIIETSDGKRPAETDIARIDWLLASGYLPLGDAGFIDRSAPVPIPASDYIGRTPSDVLAECSNESGKNYFVRWEDSCNFPDLNSPWGAIVSDYVAPYLSGGIYVPSSADLLGDSYDTSVAPFFPASPTYADRYSPITYPPYGAVLVDGTNDGVKLDTSRSDNSTTGIIASLDADSSGTHWFLDLAPLGTPVVEHLVLLNWDDGMGVFFHPSEVSVLIAASNDPAVRLGGGAGGWTTIITDDQIRSYGTIDSGTYVATFSPPLKYRFWAVFVSAAWTSKVSYAQDASWLLLWSAARQGPGPALCYHDPLWSGDSSSLRLSNDPADIDNVTTWGYDAGPNAASLEQDPAKLFSGCHFEYSGGHVYVENPATRTSYFNLERFGRDTRASDMNCTTAADANRLVDKFLARAAFEAATLRNLKIHKLPAALVNSVRQGQRIQVKMAHAPGLTGWTWMSIAHRTVEPYTVGLYDVSLEPALPVLTGFRGGGFGHTDPIQPGKWVRNTGQVVSPTSDPVNALRGQPVTPVQIGVGDGSTKIYNLGSPYLPGSVRIHLDGQPLPQDAITELDPVHGTIALGFAPAGPLGSVAGQAISATWQVG